MNELDKLRDTIARFRRSQLRLVGSKQEETVRAFAEALVRGARLAVNRYLEPGTTALVDGVIWFPSETERDAFVAAMTSPPPANRGER
jgi:hypothetical protein